MSDTLNVVGHPLILHKLTHMRRKDTSTEMFRRRLREIAQLLAYEVTRDLPLELVDIETPLMAMKAPQISGKKLCLVSILRAGNGMLDGMLEILPAARVGHVGLYRDPATLVPVEYYFKVPDDIAERLVIVVDPMLATGNSAVAALSRLKEAGAVTIKYVCLLAAPEGIAVLKAGHPEVPIYTAAVDDHLNERLHHSRPGRRGRSSLRYQVRSRRHLARACKRFAIARRHAPVNGIRSESGASSTVGTFYKWRLPTSIRFS